MFQHYKILYGTSKYISARAGDNVHADAPIVAQRANKSSKIGKESDSIAMLCIMACCGRKDRGLCSFLFVLEAELCAFSFDQN